MWSNTSATALELIPEPSRRLAVLLLMLHALSLAGLAAIHPALVLPALPLLVASLVWHLRQHGWLGGRRAVQCLRAEPAGHWRLRDASGLWHTARISPRSFCAGGWCIVALETSQGRRVLVLPPDGADPETMRRFRGRLLSATPHEPDKGKGIEVLRRCLVILKRRSSPGTPPMPTDQERLEALLSDDPDHVYSDEELDAIEAIDAEMALRIDRVQTLARREGADVVAEGPVDEARVRDAVEEARRILMQDGGDIEFVAIEDRTVRVRLKGACVGCPRAALDLRNVVERLVRSREPSVARVVNEF